MNRKNFIRTAAFGVVSGTVLLSACGGDSTTNQDSKATVDCNDLSSISDADKKQREAVQYVAKSLDPEKKCSNCKFQKVASEPNGCDGCQLFKGPVNPEGNCKTWFKKDA